MDPTPLVSIVIPVFNGESYIREAVSSILGQDYPNIELLVFDDGSTDTTPEILEGLPQTFYRERHENMGQAGTLNKGWQMSKGPILSYLSADDVLEPEAVSVSVEHLVKHPETVMTYGDYYLMGAGGETLRLVRAPDFDYSATVAKMVCQPGPGIFFRREAFIKTGGWNRALRQVPDYEYWLRLGLSGPFCHISKPLAKFRVHDMSQSYAEPSFERAEESVAVIRSFFERNDLPEAIERLKRQAHSSAHLVAARFHLRSGRYGCMASHLRQAFRWKILSLFSWRAFQLLANGAFYRVGRSFKGKSR